MRRVDTKSLEVARQAAALFRECGEKGGEAVSAGLMLPLHRITKLGLRGNGLGGFGPSMLGGEKGQRGSPCCKRGEEYL